MRDVIYVTLPVHNEEHTIGVLMWKIRKVFAELGRDFRILVVDDEDDILDLLRYNLTKEGFRVSVARDGVEALTSAEADRPDLIILDIMMPVMDGFTLAKEIRKLDTQIPFLFLTAKSMQEDRIQGCHVHDRHAPGDSQDLK